MSIATSPRLREYLEFVRPTEGVSIGGEFRASSDGKEFTVEDPASAQTVSQVADGTVADAEAAVVAAAAALDSWGKTPPRERSVILRRAFDMMIAQEQDLMLLISAENGKSQADALAEVRYAAEFFRWFSEEAVRIDGIYTTSPAGGTRTIVTYRPTGVAALITPWNFPAAMATRKIGPALAAGCTVVLRPASQTPLTTLAIARILAAAGVPAGVVNVVPSSKAREVSQVWLEAEPVRALSFTGSTRVGSLLMQQAAKRIVVSSMELGGNAPFVVAADADVDAAVEGAMLAKLRGGGQACTAANRFYVHQDVLQEFTDKFGARVRELKVGPADNPANQIGPLISAAAVEEIQNLIDGAVAQGARVVAESEIPSEGHFLAPTVLADVPADAAIMRTEIFGPVAPIAVWDDNTDLLALLNGTEFGLTSYIFSGDVKWAMQLAEQMEVGMVGINRGMVSDPAAPFGGVKESGIGREGGHEGIHEFLETQYFSVDW